MDETAPVIECEGAFDSPLPFFFFSLADHMLHDFILILKLGLPMNAQFLPISMSAWLSFYYITSGVKMVAFWIETNKTTCFF